jgi:hypothetical protein
LTQQLPYGDYQNLRLMRAIQEGKFEPPRKLRPDLPEALEALILRAMHVSPKDRFESIHALGQSLWQFASPRGQAQWKTFYFHAPPSGRDAAQAASSPSTPIDPTASLDKVAALATTAPLRPVSFGTEGVSATKTDAPVARADASHSDIAGESALSGDVRDTISRKRGRRRARLRLALVLAGAVAVAGVVMRPSRTPAPASLPSVAPLAVAPPQSSPPHLPPPARSEPASKASPAPRPKRHATRREQRPTIDQQGIGIPAD